MAPLKLFMPKRQNLFGLEMDHYFSTGGVPILISQHTIFFSHSAASNNFFSLVLFMRTIFLTKKISNFCTIDFFSYSYKRSSFGILTIT